MTETQKHIARVHEIPAKLLQGLFDQWSNTNVTTEGLLLNLPAAPPRPRAVAMPRLPEFHRRDPGRPDHGSGDLRAGFTLDLWLQLDSLAPGQVILDSRDPAGPGLLLSTTDAGTIRLTLDDGRSESGWDCDRGAVQAGRLQHLVFIVDGGPKIITTLVDGQLGDGGEARQFGWGRFSPTLRAPNGATTLNVGAGVQALRLYNRALRTSEAVGNFRAGPR